MPQQLPVLRQQQQASLSSSPRSLMASPSAGKNTAISFGATSRTDVSASSIASAQRALLPLRVGRAAGISSMYPQPHGSNGAAARRRSKAAPTNWMAVPMGAAATDSAPTPLGASPTRSHTAAATVVPTLHLEHVGFGPSLEREPYLPQAEGPSADNGSCAGADMVALQDATAGLFTRHLSLDSPRDKTGRKGRSCNGGAVLPRSLSDEGDATSPTASSALMDITPAVSAALLEAGVDDRINSLVLGKLIQRTRRPARFTAAAAGKCGLSWKGQRQDGSGKSTLLEAAATRQWWGSGTRAAMVGSTTTELHYHELPAITAAAEVCYTAASGSGGTGGRPTSTARTQSSPLAPAVAGAKQQSDLIAEYADFDAEETAGKPQYAAAPAMPSAAHAHIAAAVSASDCALVRQLVEYYCTRAEVTSSARPSTRAAVVKAPTRANIRSHTTCRANSNNLSPGASGGDAGEGGVASSVFPFASAEPAFSLLDAVMCVSREFVAQRSAAGMHGQGTEALSERRRCLLDRLTSLDQVRIPETWWITSPASLGRLAPATGTGSGTAASAVTAAEKTWPMSSSAAAALAGAIANNRASATRVSSASRTVHSGEATAVPLVESWASEQPARFDGTGGTVVRDAIQRASVVRTEPLHITEALDAGVGSQAMFGAGTSHNTIFPAPRPVERSQVYILAEVLDRMLRDPSHPRWLALLADPQVARYVLADGDDEEGDDVRLGGGGGGHGTLDADLWGTPGEQRLLAYTDAATHVLDILDTGLAELVRQVASHCVERGALLDLLRQSAMDIASANVHLLSQVKQQARADAVVTHTVRKEKAHLQQELEATRKALIELQESHKELSDRVEPLQRKSDQLDELMARVAAKARRFETFRHDEHATLLQVLMESMTSSAGAALDSFFTEVHDLQVRHSDLEGASTHLDGITEAAAGASGGGSTAALTATIAEIPSVAVARSQALEQRRTMEGLYTESHRLLSGLQELVTATNTLCGRLYDNMILKDVSPAAKVATSRWASVARAVGAFERDKRHRQRVYEVFMEYCTRHRHKRNANADLAAAQKGFVAFDGSGNGARPGRSYGEAFLVNDDEAMGLPGGGGGEDPLLEHSVSSAMLTLTEQTSPERRPQWCQKGGGDVDIDQAASAAAGVREQMQQEVGKTGTIITHADLEAMGATDCTVDEVNALFRRDFDVHKYLRGSWRQFMLQRQQQEQQGTVAVIAAPGGRADKHTTVGSTYVLRLPDVLQMLSDTRLTLAEAVLRIKSIAHSAVLQASMQPPLEPPSHPEQPCPLCNRRDTCELERHRRREAMSRIARDLQGKMDAVEAKARAAFTERDKALGEVRRLKMELQHSATAAPTRGGSTAVGVPLQPQRQRSVSRPSVTDSTITVPFVHHVPSHGLGKTSGSFMSNSATTGETGRFENSAELSTKVLSTSDKYAGSSPTFYEVRSEMLQSPTSSHIIPLSNVLAGSRCTTASYEDCDRVIDLSIPARRRSTAVMSVKSVPSAAEEDLYTGSGSTSLSTEEDAQQQQPP
ncbi:hypothetical protein LSCM1_05906 [Leishmania martiniquensis]|uniref:Uncharacterized protein n=1 Tax=Leishmania martiniquensis TaxID=1580590 RepID=A0A836HDC8_9TRYP|nr:hypothetical protein LSCM1_05906 [Leishmania martiniquensis]